MATISPRKNYPRKDQNCDGSLVWVPNDPNVLGRTTLRINLSVYDFVIAKELFLNPPRTVETCEPRAARRHAAVHHHSVGVVLFPLSRRKPVFIRISMNAEKNEAARTAARRTELEMGSL